MPGPYRDQFSGHDAAAYYAGMFDERITRSYGLGVLWHFERMLLDELVAAMRRTHARIDYLDFAAGTGRIAAHLESMVDSSTAVEISPAMAELAKQTLQRTKVICGDMTDEPVVPGTSYDLITAFRFFLKAEPELRQQAMVALAGHLKDEKSLFIFNNHGNPFSPMILRLPWYALRGRSIHYMTNAEAIRLAGQAGLKIHRVIGYGQLAGKVASMLSTRTARKWERALATWPLLPKFGLYQCYIAGLDRTRQCGNRAS